MDLEISAGIKTATEVGGDYYDFFPQKDDSVYVVVGDATGHGMTAGMMVSITKVAVPSDRKLLTNFAFAAAPTGPK